MPAETTPHRKGKDNYTVVFVPNDQSKKSRSFSVNSFGIVGIIAGTLVLVVVSVLSIVVYTPVGTYLPIASPKLEQLYGEKVNQIQTQLASLVNEVSELQVYNMRLRKALGERIEGNGNQESSEDSKQVATKKNQTEGKKSQSITKQSREQSQSNVSQIHDRTTSDLYRTFGQMHRFPLAMPVIGYTTRGFDAEENHFGIDLVAKEGSPVVAAANGNVLYADWTYDDGWTMIVAHGDGYTTVYKHNRALLKQRGESVKRGESIALLGNTGRASSGPHVHFEVWNNSVALNPINYLITIQ